MDARGKAVVRFKEDAKHSSLKRRLLSQHAERRQRSGRKRQRQRGEATETHKKDAGALCRRVSLHEESGASLSSLSVSSSQESSLQLRRRWLLEESVSAGNRFRLHEASSAAEDDDDSQDDDKLGQLLAESARADIARVQGEGEDVGATTRSRESAKVFQEDGLPSFLPLQQRSEITDGNNHGGIKNRSMKEIEMKRKRREDNDEDDSLEEMEFRSRRRKTRKRKHGLSSLRMSQPVVKQASAVKLSEVLGSALGSKTKGEREISSKRTRKESVKKNFDSSEIEIEEESEEHQKEEQNDKSQARSQSQPESSCQSDDLEDGEEEENKSTATTWFRGTLNHDDDAVETVASLTKKKKDPLNKSTRGPPKAVGFLKQQIQRARMKFSQQLAEDAAVNKGLPADDRSLEVYVECATRLDHLMELSAVILNDSTLELERGQRVRIITPRFAGSLKEYGSPLKKQPKVSNASSPQRSKSKVKGGFSAAVSHGDLAYELIGKHLEGMDHLQGIDSSAELDESLLEVFWPWKTVLAGSTQVIVAPGLIKISEKNAAKPDVEEKDHAALAALEKTLQVTDASKTLSMHELHAENDDTGWLQLRFLQESMPAGSLDRLLAVVVGTVLRDAILAEDGESRPLMSKSAPPKARWSSVFIQPNEEAKTLPTEIRVAPQHVVEWMDVLSDDTGGSFLFKNLLFNDARRFLQVDLKSSFSAAEKKASKRMIRSILRLKDCKMNERVTTLCRLLYSSSEDVYVSEFSTGRPIKVAMALELSLHKAITEMCPKGDWILCKDLIYLGKKDGFLVDDRTSIEKVVLTNMAPDADEQTFEPSKINSILFDGKRTEWCRIAAQSGSISQTSIPGIVSQCPDLGLHLPLLLRIIRVPKEFQMNLKVSLPTTSNIQTAIEGPVFVKGKLKRVGIAKVGLNDWVFQQKERKDGDVAAIQLKASNGKVLSIRVRDADLKRVCENGKEMKLPCHLEPGSTKLTSLALYDENGDTLVSEQ